MRNTIKTVFMGTPDFAVPPLQSLIKDDYFDIQLVVTQTDKKIGRKQLLTSPPVKICATKNNIPVKQPSKILDIEEILKEIKPDIIVVVAYGKIIPKSILDIPTIACINVHASLLPKYRGASCIQAAIKNLDNETGISIMRMNEGLDTGPIILQESIKLDPSENSAKLSLRLSKLASKILPEALKKFISGELKEKEQNNDLATYSPILKKEDGRLDFSNDAKKTNAHVKAMTPWPGAFFEKDKLRIKIIETGTIISNEELDEGTLFSLMNKLFVQCSDNTALEIKELQVSGKAKSMASDFISGYKDHIRIL